MKSTQSRILGFDLLRLVAIIAVIAIHVSYPPLYTLRTAPLAWWVTNITESLLRWAVPAYLMISGAFLLSKAEPVKTIFTKRLPRILIPFIFWNFIYAYLDVIQNKSHIYTMELVKSLSGSIFYHLWFIYVLVGLYVITPVLRPLVQNASRQVIEYFLVVCFIVASVIPFIDKFLHIKFGLIAPFAEGYIGYFILGYYLNTYHLAPKLKQLSYVFAGLSWLAIVFGTYFITAPSGNYDDFFHQYLVIPVVFTSIAVFVYFQDMKIGENHFIYRLSKQIDISRVTYGIYMFHIVIIALLKYGKLGFTLDANTLNPIFGVCVTTAITFIICFAIFYWLERMKKITIIERFTRVIY